MSRKQLAFRVVLALPGNYDGGEKAVALTEGTFLAMKKTITIWVFFVVGLAACGGDSETPQARADVYNDPLPPGALARLGTVRWRHGGAVFFVGLTGNGKQLVTVSQDGWCRVLDAATGKELRRFGKVPPGRRNPSDPPRESLYHFGAPAAVALSADGRFLAVLGPFDTASRWQPVEIRAWEVATGKQLWSVPFKGPNSGLAFSPGGEVLVAQGWESIRQWDTATGAERNVFPSPAASGMGRASSEAHLFAFSPDGKVLAAIVVDIRGNDIISVVKLWEVDTGKLLHRIDGNHMDFPCLAFSPDSKYLALPCSTDGTIRLWEAAAGKEVGPFEGPKVGHLYALAFSADGKTLASKGVDRVIRLWDVSTRKELRPGQGPFDPSGAGEGRNGHPGGAAQGLVFSPDGKVLFAAGDTYLVRRWDVATGKPLPADGGHAAKIDAAVFAPDGKTLTTTAADGVRQWDGATGKEIRRIELPKGAALATLAPDGRTLAFEANHAIHLLDLGTRQELRQVPLPGPVYREYNEEWLYQMQLSRNGKILATKNYAQVVRLYDMTTGKEIRALIAETSELDRKANLYNHETCFALSPSGTILVRVEIIAPGLQASIGDAPPSVRQPTISVLRFHDVSRGKPIRQVKADFGVHACVFAPDGRSMVTLNRNHTLSLWETATGKERCRFPGDATTAAFSPDSRILAVGNGPTLRLWNVLTGRIVGEFHGHMGNITAVTFAPNGRTVATGSSDATVLVWDVAQREE
jgi:WD40 repeat protein